MLIQRTLTAGFLVVFFGVNVKADEAVPLFDGKTLDGWVQKGGKAKYAAEDGAIVGHSVPNTSNSFLCTEKVYGDFVLEYEYKCDDALNSGVQIRSNVFDEDTEVDLGNGKQRKIGAGRVHGYQIEIDPNQPNRLWSAGIYDEGRRGWLFPRPDNKEEKAAFTEQGKKLYKPGDWNAVRVECRGDSIKTWLNGDLRTELKDDMTAEGFIGLQVHGVGGKTEPLYVRWRNLVIKELD
jgi:hypothetical protein